MGESILNSFGNFDLYSLVTKAEYYSGLLDSIILFNPTSSSYINWGPSAWNKYDAQALRFFTFLVLSDGKFGYRLVIYNPVQKIYTIGSNFGFSNTSSRIYASVDSSTENIKITFNIDRSATVAVSVMIFSTM